MGARDVDLIEQSIPTCGCGFLNLPVGWWCVRDGESVD